MIIVQLAVVAARCNYSTKRPRDQATVVTSVTNNVQSYRIAIQLTEIDVLFYPANINPQNIKLVDAMSQYLTIQLCIFKRMTMKFLDVLCILR